MNLSTISVLFLLELSAVCHGLTNPCRRKFEEGLEKCFDDSVGTQVDVIQTLMGSSQNPGSTETICSKKSQILSCVTKVLTNVTSSATCEKDLTEITMITGLSARLQTLIGVLCTERTLPQIVNH
ncbi:uncharacterized protein LOC133183821 [Saccostrea echinata]|uniref:uncharacterized protein LOC133183821 n=1 Tax=Saccostrea echinata TaxID=191078 RepID=UPI002A802185|nr:uncharacterized protein LOC133183821 [Saccostrea echinata]